MNLRRSDRVPTRQPHGPVTVAEPFAAGLQLLAYPGQPRPVRVAGQSWTYPVDIQSRLFSSNPVAPTRAGMGVVTDASNIGFQLKRAGVSSDAYVEVPTGSDYTFLFETVDIGYTGTNPGWYRSSNGTGSNFLLLPAGGLWLRHNGSDFTSSVARPAAGSRVVVAVAVKSGAWVKAYINGVKVLDATTSTTTGNFVGVSGFSFIGRHSGSEYLTGVHGVVDLWYRALDEALLRELSLNPHAIGTAGVLEFGAGAGGGSSLSASIAETGSAADALTSVNAASAAVSEIAGLSDAVSGSLTAALSVSESATGADGLSAAAATAASATETASAAATLSATVVAAAAVVEPSSAVDFVSGSAGVGTSSVDEGASAVDACSSVALRAVVLVELIGASDAQAANWVGSSSISESSPAIDAATGSLVTFAWTSEPADVSDECSAAFGEADELYPLKGMTQTYPLTGLGQDYPLAGQSQTYPLGN